MGTEVDWKHVARASGKYSPEQLELAERTSTTKRQRRVAEFDMQRFIHAYHLNGPTDIALTFADYMGQDTLWRLQQQIAGYCPITLQSHGFGPEFVDWTNEKDW
jgi:adenylosuccinate synthase